MVSKEVLSWSQAVAVDPSEVLALPSEAREVVKGKPGVTPKVFVMNPALTKSYGSFDHAELKGKNWAAIFRKARAAVSAAVADGSFAPAGTVAKVEGAEVEEWKSAAGSTIKAKLVAVEDDSVFVFETANGKTIRTTADKLSEASVKRARELVGE